MAELTDTDIRESVRERYAAAARAAKSRRVAAVAPPRRRSCCGAEEELAGDWRTETFGASLYTGVRGRGRH